MTLITDVPQFHKLDLLAIKTRIQSFRKILRTMFNMTAMATSKITFASKGRKVTNELSSIRLPKHALLILSNIK